jgi:hypothetical protein
MTGTFIALARLYLLQEYQKGDRIYVEKAFATSFRSLPKQQALPKPMPPQIQLQRPVQETYLPAPPASDTSFEESTSREAVTACNPRRKPGVSDAIKMENHGCDDRNLNSCRHIRGSASVTPVTPGLRLGLHAAAASQLVDPAKDVSDCKDSTPLSKTATCRGQMARQEEPCESGAKPPHSKINKVDNVASSKPVEPAIKEKPIATAPSAPIRPIRTKVAASIPAAPGFEEIRQVLAKEQNFNWLPTPDFSEATAAIWVVHNEVAENFVKFWHAVALAISRIHAPCMALQWNGSLSCQDSKMIVAQKDVPFPSDLTIPIFSELMTAETYLKDPIAKAMLWQKLCHFLNIHE